MPSTGMYGWVPLVPLLVVPLELKFKLGPKILGEAAPDELVLPLSIPAPPPEPLADEVDKLAPNIPGIWGNGGIGGSLLTPPLSPV